MLQAAKKAGLISEETSQIITPDSLVIDRNKIRREIVKSGTKLKMKHSMKIQYVLFILIVEKMKL